MSLITFGSPGQQATGVQSVAPMDTMPVVSIEFSILPDVVPVTPPPTQIDGVSGTTAGRERDIRNEVVKLLASTNAFDAVWTGDFKSDDAAGVSPSATLLCCVQPFETVLAGGYDAGNEGADIWRCRTLIEIAAINDDPQARDDAVERLVLIAKNRLAGQTLGGIAMAQTAKIVSWHWQKPIPPSRVIACTFECYYMEEGWDVADTSE